MSGSDAAVMKKLFAFDVVIAAYAAILSAIVIACRPPAWGVYLGYHAVAVAMMGLVIHAHGRFGGRFWTVARYWYVIPLVLGAFRELHYLVPAVHPFSDFRFDRALAAIDRKWFGDVDGFFLRLFPPFAIDLLHLCYWFYFVSMMIAGVAIQRRGEYEKLREYVTVVLASLFLSYLGYVAVPAVGPHHFLLPRPSILDGWVLGGPFHAALMAAEWEMPDAFPSGHALLSMVVIALAWRYHRPTFRWVALPASGCVLATVALRYHYVIDVVASAALLPVCVPAGTAFARWWEGKSEVRGLTPEAGILSPPGGDPF